MRSLGSGEISFSGGFSEYLCPSCDEIAFMTQHPTTEEVGVAGLRPAGGADREACSLGSHGDDSWAHDIDGVKRRLTSELAAYVLAVGVSAPSSHLYGRRGISSAWRSAMIVQAFGLYEWGYP